MTVVVADTGDINSIRKFRPRDATTNPSLITAAAQMEEYREVVDAALKRSRAEVGRDDKKVVARAIDRLAVEFGTRILEVVEGRVSTEVDARLSYDEEATYNKARELMGYYKEAGIGPKRVLIKVAATWEGIRAAERLEKEGIHCNLTLLFGMHQTVACAQANITLISKGKSAISPMSLRCSRCSTWTATLRSLARSGLGVTRCSTRSTPTGMASSHRTRWQPASAALSA